MPGRVIEQGQNRADTARPQQTMESQSIICCSGMQDQGDAEPLQDILRPSGVATVAVKIVQSNRRA